MNRSLNARYRVEPAGRGRADKAGHPTASAVAVSFCGMGACAQVVAAVQQARAAAAVRIISSSLCPSCPAPLLRIGFLVLCSLYFCSLENENMNDQGPRCTDYTHVCSSPCVSFIGWRLPFQDFSGTCHNVLAHKAGRFVFYRAGIAWQCRCLVHLLHGPPSHSTA